MRGTIRVCPQKPSDESDHMPSKTGARPVTYCGCCAGRGVIWCPDCCGFRGCHTCRRTYRVPCPVCAGGKRDPIRWS